MNPITKIRAALGDLASIKKEKQAKREKILQRIDELHHLPPRKEDVLETLYAVVDAGAEDYANRLQVQLTAHLQNGEMGTIAGQFPLLAPNSGRSWFDILGVAVYGLLGQQVKESLARIIQDMPWPEAGPSISERRNEIEQLHKQLTVIERELAELEEAAKAAGVTIQ